MRHRYTPSGVAPLSGVMKTLLFGVLSAILLPLFYVIINRLIPNIWFATLMSVCMGLCLGAFINLGVQLGKLRNVKIVTCIALFCGLLAFYVQWVIFDDLMYSNKGFTFSLTMEDIKVLCANMFYLFIHPAYLWEDIKNLNVVGTFRIGGGQTISGLFLWLVWAGEFFVIMATVILSVRKGVVSEPYSEVDDCWMKKRKPGMMPFVEDKEELIKDFDRGNFSFFDETIYFFNSNNPCAELVVWESARDSLKFVTITNVSTVKKKIGKDNILRNEIVKYYPILNPPDVL